MGLETAELFAWLCWLGLNLKAKEIKWAEGPKVAAPTTLSSLGAGLVD